MNPLVALKNVTCRRGDNFLLDVADLQLLPGRVYPLVGSNGSGKSTLLRILALLQPVDTGEIHFAGRPVTDPQAARRTITMVDQSPYLLSGTVADNLRFGLSIRRTPVRRQQQLITATLDQVGLPGFENRKATTLSSGEKQRVALARALILKPELLLLDEPTANIDRDSVPQLELVLHRLPALGITLVCATHDPKQPERLGGTVLQMDKGRLITS